MNTVLLILVGALTKASIYFLVAAGLTLVFGVGQIINFAHGSFYVLAMYLTYTLAVQVFGGGAYSFWPALLLAPIMIGVLGLLIERFLLSRVYGKEHLVQLILTYGLVFIFSDLFKIVWGVYPVIVPHSDFFGGSIAVMQTFVPQFNLVIIAFAILIYFGLTLMISKTSFGRYSRAIATDSSMSQLIGIDTGRVFTLIFGLGCALAAIGGALATQLGVIQLGFDSHITILAFILVIVGGVGSIKGAAAAALLIGFVECIGALFLPDFVLVLIYLVMVTVLLFRPFGLFGRPVF
jgi:branched-subunit amino acid ABC-type transport system permease component